jgi:hypothetical protein
MRAARSISPELTTPPSRAGTPALGRKSQPARPRPSARLWDDYDPRTMKKPEQLTAMLLYSARKLAAHSRAAGSGPSNLA